MECFVLYNYESFKQHLVVIPQIIILKTIELMEALQVHAKWVMRIKYVLMMMIVKILVVQWDYNFEVHEVIEETETHDGTNDPI